MNAFTHAKRRPRTPRERAIIFAARGGQCHKCTRKLGPMTMLQMLKGEHPDCTVHGFRSSFRDWVGDQTSYPERLAEAALAHTIGSSVERAYRRGDALERRRKLMEAWAAYCGAVGASNVVPLQPLRVKR